MARRKKSPKGEGKRLHAKMLEGCTEQIFQHGFVPIKGKTELDRLTRAGRLPARYFVTQFPYRHLYGWDGKKDTFIWDGAEGWMIECKFQDGSGSKCEAFYLVFESCLRAKDVLNWIFIYDGLWWQTSAGLKAQAFFRQLQNEIPPGKRFLFLSRAEFRHFVRQQWGDRKTRIEMPSTNTGDLFTCTD